MIKDKTFAILLAGTSIFNISSALAASNRRAPVVVELFTSQGCSSCPPADQLLSNLAKSDKSGPEIIVVSEHVDYWNHLGWKDPFSAKFFTERQNAYARVFNQNCLYTPEMVVDGKEGFGGTDSRAAAGAIASRANEPKLKIPLSAVIDASGKSLIITFTKDLSVGRDEQLVVFLTQNNLTVPVRSGENSGRILSHTGVARAVKTLDKPVEQLSLPIPQSAGILSIKVVALRQNTKSMAITGAGVTAVSKSK